MAEYKDLLHQMTETSPTQFWNDSCGKDDLPYAISHGATGATSNPSIVGKVLAAEMEDWKDAINSIITDNPDYSEVDVTWKFIELMVERGAKMLHPVWEKDNCRGRISIQVNPQLYRNAGAMTTQANHFNSLAPNIQVKLPITQAGLKAISRATSHGISINGTVGFSVAQSIAVAESVEAGLRAREGWKCDTSTMSPVCTILVGRLDDWLKEVRSKKGIKVDPYSLDWAGIAVLKRAYEIFQERGYRTKLLLGAFRGELQWTEVVGGDVILTLPPALQAQFNDSGAETADRIAIPVHSIIIKELELFDDFRRAYEPNGLDPGEFEHFPPSRKMLRQFLESYADLLATMRNFMVADPSS